MRALVLSALVACKQHAAPRDAPARPPHGDLLGTFTLTYYWIPVEQDVPGPAVAKLYDRKCHTLVKVSAKFAHDAALAGAGKLADGRMLTVDGNCDCPRSPCFRVVAGDEPWGIGASNRALVPFHSLAVDRDVVTIGAALWVPELDGLELPGYFATQHDGCLVADDVGGNITGKQIDWFVAQKTYYLELDGALHHLDHVSVYAGGARCH
jgi:3D (Asp-Asp-Asp) domain-containing protein